MNESYMFFISSRLLSFFAALYKSFKNCLPNSTILLFLIKTDNDLSNILLLSLNESLIIRTKLGTVATIFENFSFSREKSTSVLINDLSLKPLFETYE